MSRRLSLVVLGLLCVLCSPAWAGAADGLLLPLAQSAAIVRGPGLYLNLIKFIPVLLLFVLWVSTTHWIEKDTKDLHNIYYTIWNVIAFFTGILGFALLWLVPNFYIGLVLLLAAYFGPLFTYIYNRNQLVGEYERVMTGYHLGEVANGLLEQVGMRPMFNQDVDTTDKVGPPVTFIGKSAGQNQEDPSRVSRAEESPEYYNAKELFYDAIQRRATDIALEPTPEATTIRYRIDGVWHTAQPFERPIGDSVTNIVKVLSALDITERRKPQDGSFSLKAEGRDVDVRVATSGTKAGEKLAVRILDKTQNVTKLDETGMRPKMIQQIKELLAQPNGFVLFTGPTGSGKSTTVYACLREIDRFLKNVVTLEEPIEFQIDNVSQTEINTKTGQDYGGMLRSLLRQQPDIVMIGEIRDEETAGIAFQAASTGNLVLSTLHATDAITAVNRLLHELHVEPSILASGLTAVLSQRLVRKLCETCKEPYKPKPEFLKKANLPADKVDVFYKPPVAAEQVCPDCGGNGYIGRTGIFELLVVDEPIRELIRTGNPSDNAMKAAARKNGMVYLTEDGLRQVIQGKTSIDELMRVVK
jgi:type II secretory ATPase GspE/PulE/Tfp pilus assembly ATPase PilB-like protein